MLLYDTLPNVDGVSLSYTAEATNITGPGATDGTGLQASILNDEWGFNQACLKYAGVAPSGTVEDADTSQILASIINSLSPVGTVLQGMWNTDPASLGIRALPLEGQGVLIADYAALVAACYVGDSDNATAEAFYKADDAAGTTPNTSGTYFILPDTRGSFLRDNDSATTYDPYGDRTMGEVQAGYMQDHRHPVLKFGGGSSEYLGTTSYQEGTGTSRVFATFTTSETLSANAPVVRSTNANGDTVTTENTETAPRNAICRFAIRY